MTENPRLHTERVPQTQRWIKSSQRQFSEEIKQKMTANENLLVFQDFKLEETQSHKNSKTYCHLARPQNLVTCFILVHPFWNPGATLLSRCLLAALCSLQSSQEKAGPCLCRFPVVPAASSLQPAEFQGQLRLPPCICHHVFFKVKFFFNITFLIN